MKRIAGVTLGLALLGGMAATMGHSDDHFRIVREFLSGYEEVATGIGAISTTGRGKFVARINRDHTEIDYWLTYDELEGDITQAHIHFGQKHTSGGISVWLCGTATNSGPTGTPACPAPGEWVSGTLTEASVVGPVGAGIEPGAWNEFLAALRAGTTYANIHSTKWPGGEVRSQIEDEGRFSHKGHH
jgi:CHRD domain-containing protein